jgi:CelD/BcsL family acetyltransferase involved in cellulose biosynthesis
VRVEVIELATISGRDVEAWRDLAGRALEPNPFFEPDYVEPLARGLGRVEEVRLAVCREGSEWALCFPFHTPARWHRMPLPAVASWRGHVLYGLLGTPLVAGGDPGGALAATVAALARRRAAFLAFEWVAAGRVGDLLDEALERRPRAPLEFERFQRAAVRRRPEPTYLEETLSAKHRRDLARLRRRLGDELDAEPELVDRAQSEAAYGDFVALESAGRKGEWGTVIGQDPGHVRFFVEMCHRFAAQGRLHLFELRGGDRTVAAKCSLVAGDTIFSLKIAYDDRWSAYSPGILLVLDTLKHFHEHTDADLMDSCADPNNAMINRLWPDRRELVSEVLPGGGAAGLLARPALKGLRTLRDRNRARREAAASG